jgi:hypothetical protein
LSADRATEVSNGRPTRFIRGRRNFDAGQIDDALRVFGLSADGGRPREVWFGEVLDGLEGSGVLPLLARGHPASAHQEEQRRCHSQAPWPGGGIDIDAWREGAGSNHDAKIEDDGRCQGDRVSGRGRRPLRRR